MYENHAIIFMINIRVGTKMREKNEIIVAKFGGSSLADSSQFMKVKSIVKSDSRRKFVVPSAPGKRVKDDEKITDLLYRCHSQMKRGLNFQDTFDIIAKRYRDIVKELSVSLGLDKVLDEIKCNIKDGASADYTASRGEYLSGLILSGYLGYEFVDARDVIFFDKDGRFDQEKTQAVLSGKLLNLKNAVIPGFYGSLPNGEIKTFSRGGSDITGSIVARGVNAGLYENWTDVSGFMMADPRIVDNPKVIKRVTYRELRELSYMGATVLHDEAIFPVRKAGIPINIRNTNAPEDAGTMIVSDADRAGGDGTITGIAGKKNFTVIALEKTMMNAEVGFGRKLLSVLEKYGVSFEHMPTGIDTISLVVEDCELNGNLDSILQEIKEQCSPDSIQVHPNMALIATVGLGMAYTVGVSAAIFTALARAGVNVRMIDQGSSGINIIVGIETDDFEKAVNAIYNAFVK